MQISIVPNIASHDSMGRVLLGPVMAHLRDEASRRP
jgi:hypothetical protein